MTAVLIEGEAEWCAAALSVFAGIDVEEAQATLLVYAEQELGCEPGTVPVGRIEFAFRLCRDCGRRTDVEVTKDGRGRPGVRAAVGREPSPVPAFARVG
ncbi:MAG: hypothetical protein ACRDV2_00300 [Actinomycetes bacterium]